MTPPRDKPRLRKVERLQLRRGDDVLIVLRDPTGLSEQVAFPIAAAPLLDALDGQRTVPQIRQSLALRGVLDLDQGAIEAVVRDLGDAGYLDDDAFRARWEAVHRAFLADPVRRTRWAGVLYPDDPAVLAGQFAAVLGDPAARLSGTSDVLGVLVPHQPPPTGAEPPRAAARVAGELMAATLHDLPRADALDLVVVLGTDYHPGLLPFALTDKRHATPLGEAPTDPALVRALVRRLPWIRREEIRHRDAMSSELAVAALKYMYGETCPPVLSILCGPAALDAAPDGQVETFIATMEHVLEDRRVLWWIAAELSHDGPAYGRPALQSERVAALAGRDQLCLGALAEGRTELLARRLADAEDSLGRPSGAAALVSAARLFPVGYAADRVGYAAGRPPGPDDGWVGLAGLRFIRPGPEVDDDPWLTPAGRPRGE